MRLSTVTRVATGVCDQLKHERESLVKSSKKPKNLHWKCLQSCGHSRLDILRP